MPEINTGNSREKIKNKKDLQIRNERVEYIPCEGTCLDRPLWYSQA